MNPARWIAVVALLVAAYLAWGGGEYSTPDYFALKRAEAQARVRKAALQHEVDSLKAFRDSLENDPRVQEREARERWGMVRPGEMTFLIVPTDSSAPDSLKKQVKGGGRP